MSVVGDINMFIQPSTHPLLFKCSCYSNLNRRPLSLPIMVLKSTGAGDKFRGCQNTCDGAGEERAEKPHREEHATPCIESLLRPLMRSAQAMSSSLLPFKRFCSHINVLIFSPSSKGIESTTPSAYFCQWLTGSHLIVQLSRASDFTKKRSLSGLRCRHVGMNRYLAISLFPPPKAIGSERSYRRIMWSAICTPRS